MDEDSIDAFQTLASIRLSQNRQQDACIYINKVFDRIMLIRKEIHARSVIKEIQGEDLQVYDGLLTVKLTAKFAFVLNSLSNIQTLLS